LLAFQDVTWIEVVPQSPGPEGVPQTCTAVPGGIQGFTFHAQPLNTFSFSPFRHSCPQASPLARLGSNSPRPEKTRQRAPLGQRAGLVLVSCGRLGSHRCFEELARASSLLLQWPPVQRRKRPRRP
jgi:hypothetical protein